MKKNKDENKKHIITQTAETIKDKLHSDGYNSIIPHEELDSLLQLSNPLFDETIVGKEEYAEALKEYNLKKVDMIKELNNYLLDAHNFCIDSVAGEGYKIPHPREQVSKVASRYNKKFIKALKHEYKLYTHVDSTQLTDKERRDCDRRISRAVFQLDLIKKKTIPQVPELIGKKKKQLKSETKKHSIESQLLDWGNNSILPVRVGGSRVGVQLLATN